MHILWMIRALSLYYQIIHHIYQKEAYNIGFQDRCVFSRRLALSLSLMGWVELVGSIQLYVSFAQEPYKRDNILQKRFRILLILLTVAPPYQIIHYVYQKEAYYIGFQNRCVFSRWFALSLYIITLYISYTKKRPTILGFKMNAYSGDASLSLSLLHSQSIIRDGMIYITYNYI